MHFYDAVLKSSSDPPQSHLPLNPGITNPIKTCITYNNINGYMWNVSCNDDHIIHWICQPSEDAKTKGFDGAGCLLMFAPRFMAWLFWLLHAETELLCRLKGDRGTDVAFFTDVASETLTGVNMHILTAPLYSPQCYSTARLVSELIGSVCFHIHGRTQLRLKTPKIPCRDPSTELRVGQAAKRKKNTHTREVGRKLMRTQARQSWYTKEAEEWKAQEDTISWNTYC